MKKILLVLLCLALAGGAVFLIFGRRAPSVPVQEQPEESSEEKTVLEALPEGKLALSFTIRSFSAGFSAKLLPGDVICVFTLDPESREPLIPRELHYLEVVTTTTSGGIDREEVRPKDDGGIALPASVTVIVSEAQAARLVYLEQEAYLHVALVCRAGDEKKPALLARQEELLAQPELLPVMPGDAWLSSDGASVSAIEPAKEV